jgi:hypothetical protein
VNVLDKVVVLLLEAREGESEHVGLVRLSLGDKVALFLDA